MSGGRRWALSSLSSVVDFDRPARGLAEREQELCQKWVSSPSMTGKGRSQGLGRKRFFCIAQSVLMLRRNAASIRKPTYYFHNSTIDFGASGIICCVAR